MASDNVLDVLEELREIVGEFKRILYGDTAARTNGLVVEFGDLRRDVQALRDDVHRLKNRKPNVWLWVMGYLSFAASVTFGVIGILNLAGHAVFGLPAAVALWLAAALGGMALVLFLGGFGWLDRA